MAAGILVFKMHKNPRITQPYHWTLNSVSNGQVICHSENYVRKADAMTSLNLVFNNAGDSLWEDLTGEG